MMKTCRVSAEKVSSAASIRELDWDGVTAEFPIAFLLPGESVHVSIPGHQRLSARVLWTQGAHARLGFTEHVGGSWAEDLILRRAA